MEYYHNMTQIPIYCLCNNYVQAQQRFGINKQGRIQGNKAHKTRA